jgi:protein-disulfide isomerase
MKEGTAGLCVPAEGEDPGRLFDEDTGEADGQEQHGQDDGGVEEDLLDAALGPEDVAVAAESGAEPGTLLLQEDHGDQQDGNGHLRDEQGVFHIPKLNKRGPSRQSCAILPDMDQRRGVSSALVTVITLLALALVLGFLWRVYAYYRQIRSGVVTLPQFSSSFTASGGQDGASAAGAEIATSDDPSVGPSNARLTIVEFLDYQCPYCNQASPVVREISAAYGDRVRFIIRDFPVVDIHADAGYAAEAAGCAEAQGKYWQMHDRLFALNGQLKATDLARAAEQSGLDTAGFRNCMTNHDREAEIEADLRDGVAAGVHGTPTFFFNGQKVEGAIPKDQFERLINGYLAR